DLSCDRARPWTNVLIRDERHRCDLTGAMTRHAVRIEDRCDITCECRNAGVGGLRCGLRPSAREDDRGHEEDEHAPGESRGRGHGCLFGIQPECTRTYSTRR